MKTLFKTVLRTKLVDWLLASLLIFLWLVLGEHLEN